MKIIEIDGLTYWMLTKKEFNKIIRNKYNTIDRHEAPKWTVPKDEPVDRWASLKEV